MLLSCKYKADVGMIREKHLTKSEEKEGVGGSGFLFIVNLGKLCQTLRGGLRGIM